MTSIYDTLEMNKGDNNEYVRGYEYNNCIYRGTFVGGTAYADDCKGGREFGK